MKTERPGMRQFCTAVSVAALAATAVAQDGIVANPSFEVGSGLDGWSAFGDVSVSTGLRVHGARAVSIGGPNTGGWAVSGAWQPFPAEPGDVFDGVVRVGHEADTPITGLARGIVNVEWRDADGELIDYDTFDVLTASDRVGTMRTFRFTAGPAPEGAATARLLPAMLQSPAQETGRVVFDLVDFIKRTTPTYDEQQWGDFPGGRTLVFAGFDWRVKGPGVYGPGPNFFSDRPEVVDVVGGELVMNQRRVGDDWASGEVVLSNPLGYGDYVFTTRGRLDDLAPNTVLGLFLWQYPVGYDAANLWNQHNEIDVEISRWNDPANDVAQFVVQPYNAGGNIERFDIAYADDELVSYAFEWLPGRVDYRAWRGGPGDESPATIIHEWTYAGRHLPRPEQPRVHINLWVIGEAGPSDGVERTVVVSDFAFRSLADTDRSGTIDFFDVIAFLEFLHAGDRRADVNNDGAFDSSDAALLLDTIAGAW